jgi:hypothetical protein
MPGLMRRVEIKCEALRLVRSGEKNLGPTGLRKAHPRRGMVVSLTAVMQELRKRSGLPARKSQRGTARSTEQRAKVGLRKNACEDTRGREIRQAFCLGLVVNRRSLQRHIWALCRFAVGSQSPAMPMEVWTRRDIASVTPKKRVCDAHVSDKGGRSDFWLSSRRLTCHSPTTDDVPSPSMSVRRSIFRWFHGLSTE